MPDFLRSGEAKAERALSGDGDAGRALESGAPPAYREDRGVLVPAPQFGDHPGFGALQGLGKPLPQIRYSREGGRKGVVLNLPNLITIARILLVPVVVWAIASHEMQVAFILFLLAGVSDAVDGFLAKRFHMKSELGAYLDPLRSASPKRSRAGS